MMFRINQGFRIVAGCVSMIVLTLCNALASESADVFVAKAVALQRIDLVQSALNSGADPNTIASALQKTVLCDAIDSGSSDVVALLISAGANPNMPCTFIGDTPLTIAAAVGDIELARILLSAGADPALFDSFDRLPADIARSNGFIELAKLLETDNEIPTIERPISCFSEHAFAEKAPKPELVITAGHGGDFVTAVDVSADGSLMVTGGGDGTVRLWNTKDGALIRTWRIAIGDIRHVFLEKDSKKVGWVDEFGGAVVVDYVNDDVLMRIPHNGETDITSNWRYDAETSQLVRIVQEYSRDGPTVITLFSLNDCGKIIDLKVRSEVSDVLLLPAGLILYADDSDGKIKLVDIDSRDVISKTNIPKGWRIEKIERMQKAGLIALGMIERTDQLPSPNDKRQITLINAKSLAKVEQYELSSGAWIKRLSIDEDTNRILVSDGFYTEILTRGRNASAVDLGAGDLDIVEFLPGQRCVFIAAREGQAGLVDLDKMEFCQRFKWDVAGVKAFGLSADESTLLIHQNGLEIWSLKSGRRIRQTAHEDGDVTDIAVSHDRMKVATSGTDGSIRIYEIATGFELEKISDVSPCGVASIEFGASEEKIFASGLLSESEDGAFRDDCDPSLSRLDRLADRSWRKTTLGQPKLGANWLNQLDNLEVSADGTTVFSSAGEGLFIWSEKSGFVPCTFHREIPAFSRSSIALHPVTESRAIVRHESPTSSNGVSDYYLPSAYFADVQSMKRTSNIRGSESGATAAGFSNDGSLAYVGTQSGNLIVLDAVSGQRRGNFHVGAAITAVEFLRESNTVIVGTSDGRTSFMRLSDGELQLEIVSLADENSSWAVIDPHGRFDTNNIERLGQLNWRLPGSRLELAPIEIFMQEHFEPQLMAKLMSGQSLRDVSDIAVIDRTQPSFTISEVKLSSKLPDSVAVKFEIDSSVEARDLHIFVDGRLAYRLGDKKVEPWVDGIPVPTTKAEGTITISAFAFSNSGIKSRTVDHVFDHAIFSRFKKEEKARAFVIAVGVDNYDNPSWNLDFAAADADAISETVVRALESTNTFADVISLKMVSRQEDKSRVTKEEVLGIARNLGGGGNDFGTHKPPTPDDLLIFTYSGHGASDANGEFYMFASDIPAGQRRAISDNVYRAAISSAELAEAFSDIQAGSIALIVDACNASASVEAGGAFRAGPMGSRGFGQLAYSKAMSVLAASQAEGVALETNTTQNGLLTYALTKEGLLQGRADFSPHDKSISLAEWLHYGEVRVPTIARDPKQLGKNAAYVRKPRPAALEDDDQAAYYDVQQPALFDFNRSSAEIMLSIDAH